MGRTATTGWPVVRAMTLWLAIWAATSLLGGTDNDVLFGGAANDTLPGEDRSDLLYGGAGTDSMSGGDGNDYFIYALNDVRRPMAWKPFSGGGGAGDDLTVDNDRLDVSTYGTEYGWSSVDIAYSGAEDGTIRFST